jgi:uncharacterized protein (TIGR00369 family)
VTGLDYLQAMVAGKRPGAPLASLLSIRLVEARHGYVRLEGVAEERYTNPAGTIHGGWTATLLDSAAALAAYSTLPAGKTSTTADLHLHCLRPIAPDGGVLTGEGSVIHAGRTLILAQSRVVDGTGRLLAHATSTCMVLDLKERSR